MCSPVVKNIACFLTPKQSPIIKVSTSSPKIGALYLSSQKITNCKERTIKQCKLLSPKWCSIQPSDLNKEKKTRICLSVQSSTNQKSKLFSNKVSRCLFPSERPLRNISAEFTPAGSKTHDKLKVPSFDTPCRSLLSPSGLNRTFNNYVLGRGSYGVVVKGKYKNKTLAVKIISKIRNHHAYLSLIKEKNALNLNHPNIIQVFHVIGQTDQNMGFVFMELYSHVNLENLLQNNIIPFSVKLKYLEEIGNGLEYCHSNGILHLDIKPKNIIVTSLNNTCKICDFGSSTNISDPGKNNCTTKGTLKYSAPELVRGEAATEKADIYSFGITMWQIIHQETPYAGEHLETVVYKVVTQDYRPENHLSVSNTIIGPIYKACWEPEPAKRPTMSLVNIKLGEIKL